MSEDTNKPVDFIRQMIQGNVEDGIHDGRVHTRFP